MLEGFETIPAGLVLFLIVRLQPTLDVSLEAVELCALDGRTFEEGSVLLFCEAFPVFSCHLLQGFGRLKGWLCSRLRLSKLGRGTQAPIAAIEGALQF